MVPVSPGNKKMIMRNMNTTPSKADIGIDYGLEFFTQLISGEENDVSIVLLLTFGYIFSFWLGILCEKYFII